MPRRKGIEYFCGKSVFTIFDKLLDLELERVIYQFARSMF
jgi:hypothetical protein